MLPKDEVMKNAKRASQKQFEHLLNFLAQEARACAACCFSSYE